ncbi:hypothetical protein FRE64_17195 (plasmid) [Euhalothece natronophila Z-M001]|uniref:Uncharacterized protein n=1 Tax=Euhalothece natronophila Z-M001 TaxID=522448 RepID=A0A5B8NTK8_9CHRO|nr:hypothetical protein [Euhalothece natronophila]QDZ41699.1 hypothetical protein FRE64_17195 [Euhalothece natronophila Z-M001]
MGKQANAALKTPTPERINHRSLEDQGINRIPQFTSAPRLPWKPEDSTARGDRWHELISHIRIKQLLQREIA